MARLTTATSARISDKSSQFQQFTGTPVTSLAEDADDTDSAPSPPFPHWASNVTSNQLYQQWPPEAEIASSPAVPSTAVSAHVPALIQHSQGMDAQNLGEMKLASTGGAGSGRFKASQIQEEYGAMHASMMVENPIFTQQMMSWGAANSSARSQLHNTQLAHIPESNSEPQSPDTAPDSEENAFGGIVYEQLTGFRGLLNPEQTDPSLNPPYGTFRVEPSLEPSSELSEATPSSSILQNLNRRTAGIGKYFSKVLFKARQISPTPDWGTSRSTALQSKGEPFGTTGAEEQPFMPTFVEPTLPSVPQGSKQQQLTNTYTRAMARLQAIQQDEEEVFADPSAWRETWKAFKEWWQEAALRLRPWASTIQDVEGRHGSNVSLTLYFIRFALGMNLALLFIWAVLTVGPFLYHVPSTFRWDQLNSYSVKDVVKGFGMDNSPLLYGGYNYPYWRNEDNGTALHSGAQRLYSADLGFPIATGLAWTVSLLFLLAAIHRRVKGEGDAGFVKNNKLYSFSTIVFTSWDYHLTDWEAARNLRISIRTQLKEMLNDAIDFDNRPSEYAELMAALPKAVGVLVLWPAMVAMTAVASYYILRNVDTIDGLVGSSFAATALLSCVNIVGAQCVMYSVAFERWHPRHVTKITAAKLYTLKLCYLSTLLWQLYKMQTKAAPSTYSNPSSLQSCSYAAGSDTSCPFGTVCCDATCAAHFMPPLPLIQGKCIPGCAENRIGVLLYRLLLTDAVLLNLENALYAIVMKYFYPQLYDPPGAVLQVIMTQALVWIGSVFAPLMPALGIVSNVLQFWTQSMLAMHLFTPPSKAYSASRTSNVAYGLMLVTLAGCAVPLGYTLQVRRHQCGPHQGVAMKDAVTALIYSGPRQITVLLGWLISPGVLGGLCVIMAFLLLLVQGQRGRYNREMARFKDEWFRYRREMQAKMVVARHYGSAASSANSSFTGLRTTQHFSGSSASRAFAATGPLIGVGSRATLPNPWEEPMGSGDRGLHANGRSVEPFVHSVVGGWQAVASDADASRMSVERSAASLPSTMMRRVNWLDEETPMLPTAEAPHGSTWRALQ